MMWVGGSLPIIYFASALPSRNKLRRSFVINPKALEEDMFQSHFQLPLTALSLKKNKKKKNPTVPQEKLNDISKIWMNINDICQAISHHCFSCEVGKYWLNSMLIMQSTVLCAALRINEVDNVLSCIAEGFPPPHSFHINYSASLQLHPTDKIFSFSL